MFIFPINFDGSVVVVVVVVLHGAQKRTVASVQKVHSVQKGKTTTKIELTDSSHSALSRKFRGVGVF